MMHRPQERARPMAVAAADWSRREPEVEITYYRLWKAVTDGELPAIRVAGRWHLCDMDVEAWIGRRAARLARRTA